MIGFLTGIGAKAWGYIVLAGAVVLGVVKIFYAGKNAAQVEGMKGQLENVETREKVENTVNRATDPERDKLRSKWTKPAPGV